MNANPTPTADEAELAAKCTVAEMVLVIVAFGESSRLQKAERILEHWLAAHRESAVKEMSAQLEQAKANLSYDALAQYLKGVQNDCDDMGGSNVPVGYEELSPENVAIADACWRHGKDCMETAILNRLFDYVKESQRGIRDLLASG